jgi:hypothetical protein
MSINFFKKCHLKWLLLAVMLLRCAMTLLAQNGIIISNFATKAGTVTFNVSWNKKNMPKEWSDTAWVFIDYNNAGAMTRLPLRLNAGATLTTTSAPSVAKLVEVPGNNKGVWVIGNARQAGNFSATVKLLIPAANFSGMCVYAVNYPPVGQYMSASKMVFKGTPKYVVTLDNMATVTVASSYSIPAGRTINSFTDATGAPGTIQCVTPVTQSLRVSAMSYCRASEGVQFALSGTDKGATYRLYKDNVTTKITLAGSGSAATFSQKINAIGVYTAQVEAGVFCPATMTGSHNITENPLPGIPLLTKSERCGSGTVSVSTSSSGAVIDWYSVETGGTVLPNGTAKGTFTTPSINSSTTYYAQARNATTGCLSPMRAPVLITVNAKPYNPSVTAGSRCGAGTVSLSTTPPSSCTIDWYNAATGGAVVANGAATNTFTTPSLSTSTTYYAQARNTTTGCLADIRTAAPVTVHPRPANPTVTPTSRCGIGTVTLSGSSSDAIIDWYSSPTDASTLFRGNSYTESIRTSTTYYAQARNSTTQCVSASRTPLVVTMHDLPGYPLGTKGTRCGAGTVSISATSTNGVVDWYSVETGGTPLSGGKATNTFITPSISTGTTYYAEGRNSTTGCLAGPRTKVLADVIPVPATPTLTSNSPAPLNGTITITLSISGGVNYIKWGGGVTKEDGTIAYVTSSTGQTKTITAEGVLERNSVKCSGAPASTTIVFDKDYMLFPNIGIIHTKNSATNVDFGEALLSCANQKWKNAQGNICGSGCLPEAFNNSAWLALHGSGTGWWWDKKIENSSARFWYEWNGSSLIRHKDNSGGVLWTTKGTVICYWDVFE